MDTLENIVIINRPQQEVFHFVSNPANTSQWSSTTKAAEWTSGGPAGVGSTWHQIDKFLGRKLDSTIEVTIWAPPNQFGYKVVSGQAEGSERMIRLEPQATGTRLTSTFQGEIGGIFKIAKGLVLKQAKKQSDAEHDALKLLLESGEV